jgi:hypothetical protein
MGVGHSAPLTQRGTAAEPQANSAAAGAPEHGRREARRYASSSSSCHSPLHSPLPFHCLGRSGNAGKQALGCKQHAIHPVHFMLACTRCLAPAGNQPLEPLPQQHMRGREARCHHGACHASNWEGLPTAGGVAWVRCNTSPSHTAARAMHMLACLALAHCTEA